VSWCTPGASAPAGGRGSPKSCSAAEARSRRCRQPRDSRARELDSFEAGRAICAAIPADTAIPVVDFRRALGLGYCAWKLGQPSEGVELALEAADHAGDGGLVRLRAMALNLASRIAIGDRAAELRARARRLSARLEDEELLARVERPRSGD